VEGQAAVLIQEATAASAGQVVLLVQAATAGVELHALVQVAMAKRVILGPGEVRVIVATQEALEGTVHLAQ
jgi:hypothetical protein